MFEDTYPSNTYDDPTILDTPLGHTRKFQGTYKCVSMSNGRWIIRKQQTPLPIMASIMERVETFARGDRQSLQLELSD